MYYLYLFVRRSWHCSTDNSGSSNLVHENSTYILVPGTRLEIITCVRVHSFRVIADMRLGIPSKAHCSKLFRKTTASRRRTD